MVRSLRRGVTWIERLARLGYVAVGVVYAIIGGLTAAAAMHHGGKTADRNDAFSFILEQPFGAALLFIVAAGLIGYALWRLSDGAFDSERHGSDAKGWAIRIGSLARGIAYGAAAVQVIRMAMHHGGGKSSDATAKHWSATVMEKPFGRWAIGIAGAIIIGAGIYQLYRAAKAKLSKQLNLNSLRLTTRDKVVAVSRFGIAARGVVFAVIGGSLVGSAIHYDPQKARGTSGAFAEIAQQPFGPALLAIIAIGFIAYGVYAIVQGRYRRIEA